MWLEGFVKTHFVRAMFHGKNKTFDTNIRIYFSNFGVARVFVYSSVSDLLYIIIY